MASFYMRLWLMWFQCLYVDFELDQHQTQHTNLLFLLITSILTTICSKKYSLHKKWNFPGRISSVRISPADLVTFTKEILHEKLHFFVQRLWTVWLIWTGIAGYSLPPSHQRFCTHFPRSVQKRFNSRLIWILILKFSVCKVHLNW